MEYPINERDQHDEEDEARYQAGLDALAEAMADAAWDAQYNRECEEICINCCKEHDWPDCPLDPRLQSSCIVEKLEKLYG